MKAVETMAEKVEVFCYGAANGPMPVLEAIGKLQQINTAHGRARISWRVNLAQRLQVELALRTLSGAGGGSSVGSDCRFPYIAKMIGMQAVTQTAAI